MAISTTPGQVRVPLYGESRRSIPKPATDEANLKSTDAAEKSRPSSGVGCEISLLTSPSGAL